MITRRIAINLAAFLIVAVLLVLYGVIDLFGNPLDHHRTASATFPSAGGLHPHFQVSLNGVPVGEVTAIRLDKGAVKVSMSFDKGTDIPADVHARIIRSSPVGEQRIDLVSAGGTAAGRLGDGAVIPRTDQAPVPPDVGEVLTTVTNLLHQIPTAPLNNLIHEASVGLAGRASDLKTIVSSLTTLSRAYLRHQDTFRQLLATSPTLLNGLADVGNDLQSGLDRTRALTGLLRDRRFDMVKLMRDLSSLGTVGNDFVMANRTNLTCMLSDVGDIAEFMQGANLDNFSKGLSLNQLFFGAIDKIAPVGFAKDLGLGAPTRYNQGWLRVHLLLPPAQPSALRYQVPFTTPPTKPGAGCRNVYGSGAAPVTQGANYRPLYGGKVVAPSAADAEAPKPAHAGPADAATATPARLGSTATAGSRTTHAAPATSDSGTALLVVVGIVALGLLLVAVPYARYRWRP